MRITLSVISVHDGQLTEPVDPFAHPFWDTVRNNVANKAIEIRRQGLLGASMQPMAESAYAGIEERLKKLDERFTKATKSQLHRFERTHAIASTSCCHFRARSPSGCSRSDVPNGAHSRLKVAASH